MLDERLECPIARRCGGCSEIGRPYGEQLLAKADRVRAVLGGRPELAGLEVEACVAAPLRAEYRNRAKLAVARTAEGVQIGLHRRGTSEIVDLAPCRVQRPLLQEGIERLRAWLDVHRQARPEGPVFYVDLREAAGARCHLTLVVEGSVDPRRLPLEALLQNWPALEGIALNAGNPRSSYPLGALSCPVRGGERFLAPVGQAEDRLAFEVPPGGFFQVAPRALAFVHEAMAGHLAGDGRLLDLYCGVGVHGIVVARQAGRQVELCGVEESPPLVEAARHNARRHGVVGARYLTGRVERLLEPLLRSSPPGGVIVNPGRAGCHRRVVELLGGSPGLRLAYLSCNAETLARDLAGLVQSGLSVRRIVPVDLMPQTEQVEVLALVGG